MDPPLKDKQDFFEQLDACKECDDESDVLSTEEQFLRQKCKAFSLAGAVSVPRLSSPKPKLAGSRPRRTASDPISKPANEELEFVAVVPRDNRTEAIASVSAYGVPTAGSLIPETEQPKKQIITRQQALRAQSDLESSSPTSMAKRKRTRPLQMAPESKQIFKGLHFFYIPNDDVNPVRRMRITKAQEHGATWARSTVTATHIIVDNGLSYGDIKSTLDNNPTSPSVVLVNDEYPIQCLIRGHVFDPNLTVERRRYKLLNDPDLAEKQTVLQPGPESDASLQIKPRRDAQPAVMSTPESTQKSSDLVPPSHPEAILPSGPSVQPAGIADLHPEPKPYGTTEAPIFTDELATCIDAVLDDPEKHEYLDESDPDASASENEGPPEKRSKGRMQLRRNNADANFKDKFMCMRGGTRDKKSIGPNAHTIKLLEEMAEEHHLSDETWRVQSYRKAVATLRRQPNKICTAKEAAALPNIGNNLAGHIEEIASTGSFQKLDHIRSEPSRVALRMFCNVYGAGVPTAKQWVELGYRTLDDLRTKAKLSINQQLGVEHYDDLLTCIPRAEVEALGDHIKGVASAIDPSVELIIGGSYRRGADSSGDIDLIVTKDGSSSTQDLTPFLDSLVDILTKEGFLTAALASHKNNGGNKWHGCCVLPEAKFPGPKDKYRPIWRRIDFLLVPQTEIGAALVYFTGNDLFNRSMRLLARKKKMRLNHRALSGPGVHEGRDEKKIFEILGVQWREPHERWC